MNLKARFVFGLVIGSSFLFGALTVHAHPICPGKFKKTHVREIYCRVDGGPGLGDSWQDVSGRIWGDYVRDHDGRVAWMSQYDAEAYCTSHGARLPARADYEALGLSMGAFLRNGEHYDYRGYAPQILPGLGQYVFWTSTKSSTFKSFALNFYSDVGGLSYAPRFMRNAVRCVRDGEPLPEEFPEKAF